MTATGSVVKGEPAAAGVGSTPGDGVKTNWLAGPGPVGEKVALRVVWVYTEEETAHRRIVERGNPNDAYKLAHWDAYRLRRFVPDGELCDDLLMFDNTAPTSADY